MSMARTRRGRLRQVESWLRENFPTPYPVLVRVRSMNLRGAHNRQDGECYRKGKRIFIEVDHKLRWQLAIEVLIHEWAHAVVMRHEVIEGRKTEEHDEEWGLMYAKIYRAFFDNDGAGARESREHPFA